MAITTTNGNNVKFLGLTQSLREQLLKAILGGSADGKVTVNTAKVCYIGLSSTDPGTAVTEPADENYERIKISEASGTGSSVTIKSDYLTITGAQAVNSGMKKEIKFNRALSAWADTYPYFFLSYSPSGSTGLMAWGKLSEPVAVTVKDLIPMFKENKFRLYFPTPGEVETLVDEAAAADQAE